MRSMLLISFPLTAALLTVSACTWVPMAPGGGAVRVAADAQDLSVCEKRGEVGVSVKDKVGPYQRNELKVRDELETLARNEAPGLGADTVQARGEPRNGEQRFAAFRCGSAAIGTLRTRPTTALPEGEAETYPIED